MTTTVTTMEALVLHAVGDIRYERIPRPVPGPGQVLVRVGYCGVCGSDIPRIFVKGAHTFPLVPGHELAGTVEDVGEGVRDLETGDQVAVFPLVWCGRCPACEQGEYAQCLQYDYLGSRSNGGFAEYVVAPRRNLMRVPVGVSLEEAAMTEPAAVALHALRRAGGASVGETVTVFGAGAIGLLVCLWARAMGASKVLVFDVAPKKVELARRMGFEHTFDSRERDPVGVVEDLTGGLGAHISVEAAGVPATLVQALGAARRGGRVVVLGNPSAEVTLPGELISEVMRREVAVYGTWNSRYSAYGADSDWSSVLEAMAAGVLDVTPLITHRVLLSEAPEMLRAMKEGSMFSTKALVAPVREIGG